MKKLIKFISALALTLGSFFATLPVSSASAAAVPGTSVVNTFAETQLTSILTNCDTGGKDGEGIFCILNLVLQIFTYGVGIVGTLGIIISGIQYLTARDNESQLVKAKTRLFNIAIGLIAYAVMYAFLQWLIPGGVFNS